MSGACLRIPRDAEGAVGHGLGARRAGRADVGFGAFVLLRFPDRPGGTIKFQGTEVSSKGAGLPLMVLGAVRHGAGGRGAATPDVLGAVALIYRPAAGFSVLRVVDDVTCQPVGVSLDYAPGVPAPQLPGDDAVLRLSLNGSPYLLELNGGGGEV